MSKRKARQSCKVTERRESKYLHCLGVYRGPEKEALCILDASRRASSATVDELRKLCDVQDCREFAAFAEAENAKAG